MVHRLYNVIVSLLLLLSSAHAYSGGAGQSACGNLEPSHSATGQTSDSPFVVLLSKTSYTGGETIEVTLEARCGESFKGFLLQARRAEPTVDNDELLGKFSPITGTKELCANSGTPGTFQGLTHDSADLKTSLTVQWTAPSSAEGHILFKCTFVKTKTEYWVAVTSGVLNDPTAPVLTVPEDSLVTATVAPCTTGFDPTTTTSMPPVLSITRDRECGLSRGCFDDCTTECTFTVSWETVGDNIRFRLRSISSGNSYMALGFSSDKYMGGDSVSECLVYGGQVKAYQSYNVETVNSRLTSPEDGITDVSGSVNNNVFSCSFLRRTSGTADSKSFNLTQDWHLLYAQGPASSGFSISKHSSLPIVTSSLTDLQSFSVNGAAALDFPLVKAHGCLMSLAWILFTGVGLLIARFFKPLCPSKTLGGVKVWFQVHRVCMVITLVFTVVAFVLIFIEAEGYSKEFDKGYHTAHPVMGIIVTALVILNPVMAIFRPGPADSKRSIFNWAHFLVGKGAHILAIITTFFGLTMDKARQEDTVLYILAGYCFWQVLAEVCLEIVRWRAGHGSKVDMPPNSNLQMAPAEEISQPRFESINIIILGLHICVVSVLSLVLVGLLASA